MPRHDTTSPILYRHHQTVCAEAGLRTPMTLAQGLKMRVLGIHHAIVSREWDSAQRAESDCLHHINLVCSGSAKVVHRGKAYVLKPGHAYLFPGNTPLQRQCRGRYEAYYLLVRCEWFPGIDALLDWPGRKPQNLGTWDREQWEEDWRPSHKPSVNTCLRLQSQLMRWFADAVPDLDKIITRHVHGHARFAAVFQHIEHGLSAKLRIGDLARNSGSTTAAFSLSFRRATGLSPKTYVNRRLNEEIIQRLINTSQPLKQIAADLGFADEYHFNRFFTRLNGQPPARYRKRLHGGA